MTLLIGIIIGIVIGVSVTCLYFFLYALKAMSEGDVWDGGNKH